jgi:NADPH:quinone reductase-like Zn-dependent oxidoreductase
LPPIGVLDGFYIGASNLPAIEQAGHNSRNRNGAASGVRPVNQELEKTQIHPVIDKVYPFTDALAAHDHLYQGAFGNIVIRVRE